MSNAYEIKGVKIDPAAGGYYDLSHPKLADAERIRGKEAAEARALEIAEQFAEPEGSMDPQGEIPEVPFIAPATPITPTGDDAQVQMMALIAEMRAEISSLRSSQQAATPMAPVGGLGAYAQVPSHYSGQMDPDRKAFFESQGISISTIVLEESESIPPTGLFLSHNGRAFMITPGEEVDVPDFILGVLDDAVTSSPIVDRESKKVVGHRDRSRFPYRRITK